MISPLTVSALPGSGFLSTPAFTVVSVHGVSLFSPSVPAGLSTVPASEPVNHGRRRPVGQEPEGEGQVGVAADDHSDLRVGLLIAAVRRNALRDAVRPNRRIVEEIRGCIAVIRARIAERCVEARYRAEQLTDLRRTEALGVRAA